MKAIQYTGTVTFSKDGYDDDVIRSVESDREHLQDLKILRRMYTNGDQILKMLIRTTYPESRHHTYEYQVNLRAAHDGIWRGSYSYEDPSSKKTITDIVRQIYVMSDELGNLKVTGEWIEDGEIWSMKVEAEEQSCSEGLDDEVPFSN